MLLDSESIAHRDRLLLRKKRRPGVTLLLSIVPVLVVAGQVHLYLALLQLAFLNAEHVRIHILEIVHKALLHAGPYSVNVPGYHLHRHSSFLSKTSYSIFKNHPHGARMVLPNLCQLNFQRAHITLTIFYNILPIYARPFIFLTDCLNIFAIL